MKITKSEINELPMGHFEGDIVLIDRLEQVREVLDEIERHPFLGFDTETKPSFSKGVQHKVALLQLSTEDTAFLIRINEIGLPAELQELLQSRSITKIGAAVLDDLRALQRIKRNFSPASFFDLNDELKKVGFQNVGVRNLAAMVLNMRISKSEQVSNWEAATLTQKQLVYAATDAWACLQVFKKLQGHGYLESVIR